MPMTFWTLIRRSLRFHARSHMGVLLGAVIGSTTLIGALIVGDSVKGSLEAKALSRLGPTQFAMSTADRFFQANLAERLGNDAVSTEIKFGRSSQRTVVHYTEINASAVSTALMLAGTAARQDGTARANRIFVLGVDTNSWPRFADWQAKGIGPREKSTKDAGLPQSGLSPETLDQWRAGNLVFINQALARQLNSRQGDELILRIRKPSALAQDAVLTPHDDTSIALRLKVGAILTRPMLGDFGLMASQTASPNAFLPQDLLARKVELVGRANLLLHGPVLESRPITWWRKAKLRFGLWSQKRASRPLMGSDLSDLASPAQGVNSLNQRVTQAFQLEDAQLSVRTNEPSPALSGGENVPPSIDLTSSRVFLEPSVIRAALTPRTHLVSDHVGCESDTAKDLALAQVVTNGVGILTYLANLIQTGDHATPYSMVTAAGPPLVPADMRSDEMVINQWLAEDLNAKAGDKVDLVYFVVDSASRMTERTNSFKIRQVVPLQGIYADRTLMPDFPGVAKAESTHEWDTGFPLVYKIRDKDEAYWKQYRGTPKAFITLTAGQAMWASRFGSLTAIRYPLPANSVSNDLGTIVYRNLLANLHPEALGFHFEPVREQALQAASQAQDFGQLFLGFSLFLVVAALLLMAVVFQFSLEQRITEVGTLLALGFSPERVRRLLLGEGALLAFAGGVLGCLGGILYAKTMLWGLATIWRRAVAGAELSFYATPVTLGTGLLSNTAIAVITIWIVLRRQARQPARELLAGEVARPKLNRRRFASWIALGSGLCALGLIAWMLFSHDTANAEVFFTAGLLLLVAGLAMAAAWLAAFERSLKSAQLTLVGLGVRGCARRRSRSLATIALLASGCFVIAAIGVFRLDANQDSMGPTSGTGGFALLGDASLPVVQDLNTTAGREFFGLSSNDLAGVRFVPLRVHDGDEASCLNLNRAQKPRLLGVEPDALLGRFTLAAVAKGLDDRKGWALLKQPLPSVGTDSTAAASEEEIPAIGDANSIEWALGKKIGDTLEYTDASGRPFKLRLVAAVANSILQGSLLIDETQFLKRFPGESGYRMWLIDAPAGSLPKVSATLSRALQDDGLELTPTIQRLNEFNAVQNTYLGTFQILGGLGLLLGSAGLGVVVLRNVLERRGELGLLLAVGFRKRQVQWLILSEHGALLGLGLSLGVLAAAVAVLPSILSPAARLPYKSLGLTLVAICLNGALWTWLATRTALRGNLLQALRNE